MTGLPWWTTITAVTVGVRLVIFPLRLRAWKNGKLMKLTTEYCNEVHAPRLREYHLKNTLIENERRELYKKDMLRVHAETMKSIGVSPWKSLSPLPVSIPLFLSVAAGLRAIDFDGAGLGMIWRDFSEAGWMSAVPVALSNFAYIEISRRDPNLKTGSFLRTKLPFIVGHLLNSCSFVLLTQVPSAVNLFLFVSSLLSIIESRLLKESGSVSGGLLDKWVKQEFKRLIENKIKRSL